MHQLQPKGSLNFVFAKQRRHDVGYNVWSIHLVKAWASHLKRGKGIKRSMIVVGKYHRHVDIEGQMMCRKIDGYQLLANRKKVVGFSSFYNTTYLRSKLHARQGVLRLLQSILTLHVAGAYDWHWNAMQCPAMHSMPHTLEHIGTYWIMLDHDGPWWKMLDNIG